MRRSDSLGNGHGFNRNCPDITTPGNFFVDHIWLENDQLTSGVQIIELKSDDSEKSAKDDKDQTATGWSYSQQYLSNKKESEINERARERRRMKLEADAKQSELYRRIEAEYEKDCNEYMYTDFYKSGSDGIDDKVLLNHQMNCFTIFDKHFAVNTDSSDDDYTDIENVNIANVEDISDQWSRTHYEDDIVSYEPNSEMEKRTVWIYSFKNKRLLSDNDYEIVNIPSQDSLSHDSAEGLDKSKIDSALRRVATPIPSSFIPKLNLPSTPTLPTLTEVTEPRTSSSNHIKQSIDNSFQKKPINSWFLSEHATPKSEMKETLEKSKDIVNWMALSPREKRRRFINPMSKNDPVLRVLKVEEINGVTQKLNNFNLSDKESQTCDIFTINAESPNHSFGKDFYFPKDTARVSVGISCHLPSASRTTARDVDGYTDDDELSPQDRGDHNRRRRVLPQKLKIRFSPKPAPGCKISDPIENLNANKWIGEERDDKSVQTNVMTAEDFRRSRRDDMPSTLLIRNMSLLRPSEWTEYLPIAESMPSLQLSMNTDSVEDDVPWYTRWRRFVFRCCK